MARPRKHCDTRGQLQVVDDCTDEGGFKHLAAPSAGLAVPSGKLQLKALAKTRDVNSGKRFFRNTQTTSKSGSGSDQEADECSIL